MSVRIESIAIKDLGPLRDQIFKLKQFNLIYGHNETGKTFLVEFLLRSLFRETSEWMLRGLVGHGKVRVVGVGEHALDFTPESRKKLEEYWDEADLGLPTNMARLLVIKGGELQLAESRAGVNRGVLKTILSREVLLDRILDQIKKTVREATISNSAILGSNRGDLKSRDELIKNRNRLDRIIEQVEERYSRGKIRSLEIRQQELEESIAQQMQAKFHQAYLHSNQRDNLRAERAELPDKELERLSEHIKDHSRTSNRIGRLQKDHKEASEASRYHSWVEEAVSIWEARGLESIRVPSLLLLLLGVLCLTLGFVVALMEYVIPGSLLFILGVGFSGLFIWKLRNQAAMAMETRDRGEIAEDYEEKFGKSLGNLAQLKAKEKELQEYALHAIHLEKDINDLQVECEKHRFEIIRLFKELKGRSVKTGSWEKAIAELKNRAKDLDNQIHELDIALERLAVDESDYKEEGAGIEFNARELKEFEEELARVEDALKGAQRDLETLKQNICTETGDEISEPWPQVLQHLREQMLDTQMEYRKITASILAQIGIVAVLEEIRTQEDGKIRRGLQEREIAETLQRMTGIHKAIDLHEDKIILSGDYGSYVMDELSTGVKEQILIALRMGFAALLAGGEPLFLILDDAFQHSDWVRREKLVEKAADMADAGWQVTYLSMDDHIMELFSDVGKKRFGKEFVSINLDE